MIIFSHLGQLPIFQEANSIELAREYLVTDRVRRFLISDLVIKEKKRSECVFAEVYFVFAGAFFFAAFFLATDIASGFYLWQ